MRLSKGSAAGLAALALIIAAVVGWYFASPWWTLRGIREAAQAQDPDALNAYIDYPALREDLKAEIMAQMMAEAKKDDSGFGALGMAFGSAMLGPMIDGMVSPTGMRAALIANRNSNGDKAPPAAKSLQVPDDPVVVRRGFSEFLAATKKDPVSGMVFKRHGLSWKLSGVDLPPPTAGAAGTAR